jgi:hypothetical protein
MRLPDGTTRELDLLECQHMPAPAGTTSFRLAFLMRTDGPGQGSYELSAAGLDPDLVFVVPVKQRPDGIEYEAVFNQLDQE